jgi:hypothetical protein
MSRRTCSFNVLSYLVAAILLVTAAPVFAVPPGAGPDRLEQMIQDGWSPVAPGVLQRSKGGHKVETFAMGPEGFSWMVGQLQAQLGFLMDEYRARPTAQLRRTLRNQRAEIARLQSYALTLKSAAPLTEALIAGCDFSYGAHADAYPMRPTRGVRADADAYFNNNCAYSGDTYAYAYARATLSGTTTTITQTDPDSGSNISSYATAAVPGYGGLLLLQHRAGDQPGPRDQLLHGGRELRLPGAAGGHDQRSNERDDLRLCVQNRHLDLDGIGRHPGYSYAWYIDSYYVGSGSSFSRTYCGKGTAYTNTENVSLTVTDSLGWTAPDTHTTYIYFRTSTIDPCLAASTKLLPCPV